MKKYLFLFSLWGLGSFAQIQNPLSDLYQAGLRSGAIKYIELSKDFTIDESLTPRYFFIKKENGTIEHHLIESYEIPRPNQLAKHEKKDLILKGKNTCLNITNYPYSKLHHLQDRFNNPFDGFGFVVNEKDLKTGKCLKTKYSRVHPAKARSKHTEKDLLIQNGISIMLTEYQKMNPLISQKYLKDILSAYKDTPSKRVCNQLKDLQKMVKSLESKNYIQILSNKVSRYSPYYMSNAQIHYTQKAERLLMENSMALPSMLMLGTHLKKITSSEKYLKYLKKLKSFSRKWIKPFIVDSILMGVHSLTTSGTSPQEIEKELAENPLNFLNAIDAKDIRKACRRMLYDPKVLESTYSLLNEIAEAYFQFQELEEIEKYAPTKKKIVQDRFFKDLQEANQELIRKNSKINDQ